MKRFLSSLFTRYILTFIGIMILSNMISTGIVFLYYGIDVRFERLINASSNAPHMSTFAMSMGLTTITISAISIFVAVKLLVKPIKYLTDASIKVAKGDFSERIVVKGSDEVAELAKNFNLMTESLSRNELLHKDFVSNVSHEFKTPLTSMKGYAKLLKKTDLSSEKREEYLDIMIAETDRLSLLSTSLLKLSELEYNVMLLHKKTFSLDEQIRDVMVLLQHQWEKLNLEIELQLEEVEITGDRDLMYQVWVNIVGNAIKYSNQNGKLSIRLKRASNGDSTGELITVEIEDTGIGMTQEVISRIFERFYKADDSRNTSGTGLGLAISKRIVELHGAEIALTSQPGKGSCFIVKGAFQ